MFGGERTKVKDARRYLNLNLNYYYYYYYYCYHYYYYYYYSGHALDSRGCPTT